MKLYLNIPSALVDKMLATEENKSLQTVILAALREKYSHSNIGERKNESYQDANGVGDNHTKIVI